MGKAEFRLSSLGEDWVGAKTDEFFQGVLDGLGYSLAQRALYAAIKTRVLPGHGQQEGEAFHATDDRVTELWFGNRVVATVLGIRDDFNYEQLLYADYSSPELIDELHVVIPPEELLP